ncbi:MAG: hypothetical protein ACK5QH_08865 [Rubrivivax sp.]
MARIDWVKRRLDNWAAWHAKASIGGIGFSSRSVLLAEPRASAFDTWLPVIETEAEETHRAVESLRDGRSHLHRALELYYLKNRSHTHIALAMAKAESTVKAYFDQADVAIAHWLEDQAEQRRRQRATSLKPGSGGFTA